MRDDFSLRTKETLAKRVGFRCSNPRCRGATSGPHSAAEKSVNVGVAAHITAASSGGPRHDPLLSPEQRTSAQNGIWLCQNCAKLIDADPQKYTKEVLFDWKETAEHLAALELQQSPSTSGMGGDSHSISFAADDWSMWRNRGNLPGDSVWIADGWARGDVRYGCRIRLRNNSGHDEVLHHLRIEFQRGDEVVLSDEYAVNDDDITLPPRKWIAVDVNHGLHDASVLEKSDTVWFRAVVVGDNEVHRWQITVIQQKYAELQEA